MKWGEYSHDVQFILQRSDQQKAAANQSADQAVKNPAQSPPQANGSPKKAKPTIDQSNVTDKLLSPDAERRNLQNAPENTEKTIDSRTADLMGIIKSVSHTTMQNLTKISPPLSPCSSTTGTSITTTSDFGDIDYASRSTANVIKLPELQFNSADIRNSLDRKTSVFRDGENDSDENLPLSSYRSTNSSISDNTNMDSTTEAYKNGPSISSNGALVPPPYRNPPNPKTNSPLLHTNLFINHQKSDSQSSNTTNSSKAVDYASIKPMTFMNRELSPSSLISNGSHHQPTTNIHINALNNLQNIVNTTTSDIDLLNDNQFQTAQYRELLQLIHYQREKIGNQQVDISKVKMRFIEIVCNLFYHFLSMRCSLMRKSII